MGRYSSDSDEERKKRKKKKKKRSRSRSGSIESRHSSKPKKSKKKKKQKSRSRSRSRSTERYKRSRSRSYSRRSRSRSYDSKDKYRRRSRSRSRSKYSRSRSREKRRSSRSHDSYSRSSRRSRSYTPDRKSRKNKSSEREDPCANIPGFADMTPAEQAKIRMHMALKAAAAADEKLKGEVGKSQSSTSLHDSLNFSQAIQDIEASGFSSVAFKSSRGEACHQIHRTKPKDKREEKPSTEGFTFGTAGELKLDSQRKPVLVDVDKEELAHPSLYTDPEEKLDKWIQKLAALRRKKLEGEALT